MTERSMTVGRVVRRMAVAAITVGFGGPLVGADQAPAGPGAASCAALMSVGRTATTITSATYAEASAAGAPGTGRGPGLGALPAHCVVRGAIAPRVGADGKAYETRFELRLPTDWSGRFLYQGGGGNDGNVGPAVGRNTGTFPETGLARFFAVVSTDAGHQGGGPEFGLDPVARIDHAHAAHERTASTAKAILERYYGRAASWSYFVGCSGGGRQGMMFAQRHPVYFDGIVACAPAMSVSSGATIAAAWDTQTFLAVAPADAEGRPILSGAFSSEDLDLVASRVLETCDAADGATDGMVQRPMQCRFDPASLVCPVETRAGCLTAAQASALARAFDGPRDSSGRRLYAGQPWDPGIAAPGWRQWKLGTSATGTPNAANTTLMAGALAYEFFTPPDPGFALASFNFDRDPARMDAFSREYDTHRDATLAAFRARGGKLLIFHGTADGIFSASESVDYFERLASNNGGVVATQAWARLFLIPGMNHCSGGPATDRYDGLQAIVDWVEQNRAPAHVIASALPTSRYFPNRTRPLCPYPAYARYSGSGSLEDAANFTCAP